MAWLRAPGRNESCPYFRNSWNPHLEPGGMVILKGPCKTSKNFEKGDERDGEYPEERDAERAGTWGS